MTEQSAPKRGRPNLTSGPIASTLLAFALPTLFSNILQSLNGSINAMWVGRLLGEKGLAATSNANLIMFLVFALIFGFGMATTILIGQNMGRRDMDAVRRAVGAGVGLFGGISIVFAVVGWFAMPWALRAMGVPDDVYPMALAYARVMFLGLPPAMVYVYLQFALRGAGDALTPLLFMIPSALIDVTLNPILIQGLGPAPKLGIAGSSASGVIANYIVLVALLVYIYARDLPIRLRGAELKYLTPARDLVIFIVQKGTPMGLQMIIMSGAAIAMMGLVNAQGTSTVAAYGATNQLWTYIQMPAMAIGAGVSAMAAQNIGAGFWDRIDKIAIAGVIMNIVVTGVFVLAVTIPDRLMLGFFLGSDTASIEIGRHINLLAGWSFILFAITMTLTAAPRANGATMIPLLIIVISLIPGRLGAAYLLGPVLGPDALWWSFSIGSAIALILTIAYYRWGKWREMKVLERPTREQVDEIIQIESEPVGREHPAG